MNSITTHEWMTWPAGVIVFFMNAQRRRALVIGGGIAGPAAALFLARAGIEPTVFEAYPRTDDVGGGLQIAPNGLRVLAELGLTDTLFRAGHAASDMAFRNHRGRDIGLVRTGGAGPALNIDRPVVHRVLRDEADRRGVSIRYEKRLRGLTLAGREVVATFDDGSTEVGDFLVGADGVRSSVRAALLPSEATPRDTSMVSIGGLCAAGVAPPDDAHDRARLTFVVGPKYQFGYSMFAGERWGFWCHVHVRDHEERQALLAMPPDELRATMLRRYAGWSAPVTEFIQAAEIWHRTSICDVPRLSTWHRGPIVLLGDAAHAMSPAGGQGASLALEDALVFGKLVADGSRSIDEAMARFETIRRPRAEPMVAQAYENDRRTLAELGPVGMWTRDRIMMPLFASFIGRALNKVYSAPIEATMPR